MPLLNANRILTGCFLTFSISTSILYAENRGRRWSRPYGLAGCGLGSVIVGKKGLQLFAATSNATSTNQTSGITSGTLNCIDDPNIEVASRMDRFIIANQVALASDIARGKGESLEGLSYVMSCKKNSALGSTLQKNYINIFPDTTVSANEITDAIISTVRENNSVSCSNIIG